MPYKSFDFPYHSVTHAFPEGDQVRFGRGYSHAAEPDRPVQRMLLLRFSSLLYIRNPYTLGWLRGADTRVDVDENAKLNELKKRCIWALHDFYEEHMLFKKFTYQHYVFGELVVRFAQPFEMPQVAENTANIHNNIPTMPFDVRLIEQPE